MLIDHGARLDLSDKRGFTPLGFACASNGQECVKLLLKNGADINSLNSNDQRPLHCAAYKGHVGVIQILYESG